jgi:hypothetical protein
MRRRQRPRQQFLRRWNLMVGYHQRSNNHPSIPPTAILSSLAKKGGGLDSDLTQRDVENLDGGVDPVVAAGLEDANKELHTNPFLCT